MDQQILDRLKQSVKALKGKYGKHKAAAQAAATSYRWATGRYYSIAPFDQERLRFVRGKLLEKEPKARKDAYCFGFDTENRLVLARSFKASGKASGESFTTYSGNTAIERTYIDGGKSVGKLVELTLVEGLAAELHSMGSGGDHKREVYHHDAQRLVAIDVEQFDALTKQHFGHRFEFAYDRGGSVTATLVGANGKRSVAFTIGASVSMEKLLPAFEQLLAQEIHAAVLRLTDTRRAYCIAINYNEDAERGCIPVIGVGFLKPEEPAPSPCAKVLKGADEFWNPAEFSSFGSSDLQPGSTELKELDQKLSSASLSSTAIDTRALCNRVAVLLNGMDWQKLPRTDAFIAYAVDDDLADLKKNLKFACQALSASGTRP